MAQHPSMREIPPYLDDTRGQLEYLLRQQLPLDPAVARQVADLVDAVALLVQLVDKDPAGQISAAGAWYAVDSHWRELESTFESKMSVAEPPGT